MCGIYLILTKYSSNFYVSFPESTSSCNRSSLNDVHILNLSQMKELKILNENRDPVADPPSLNVARVKLTQCSIVLIQSCWPTFENDWNVKENFKQVVKLFFMC